MVRYRASGDDDKRDIFHVINARVSGGIIARLLDGGRDLMRAYNGAVAPVAVIGEIGLCSGWY